MLLLPATTRYESEGGGTETSTERRIIFSPEIPGRRVGEARPEWRVFGEVARRARPDARQPGRPRRRGRDPREIAAPSRSTPASRGSRARATRCSGAGRRLYADGRFATADGKAHFAPVTLTSPPRPAAGFTVSTRRGKQFNSMVQRDVDPLTGAARDDILISADDLAGSARRRGRP